MEDKCPFLIWKGKESRKAQILSVIGKTGPSTGPQTVKIWERKGHKNTFLLLLILSYVPLSLMPRVKMNDLGDAMTQLTLLGDLSVYE